MISNEQNINLRELKKQEAPKNTDNIIASQSSIKCSNPHHINHKVNSLCMKNIKDPTRLLTLNCSQCVKQLSSNGNSKQLMFCDYPDIIYTTYDEFKQKKLEKLDSERKLQLNDIIKERYESLAKEFKKISDFYSLASQEIEKKREQYSIKVEKEDHLAKTEHFFGVLLEQMKLSNEQHVHEELMSEMTGHFNVFQGIFVLKELNSDEKEIQKKLKNIQYLKDMGEQVWKIHEEVRLFNQETMHIHEFIPQKKDLDVDKNLTRESDELIQRGRKTKNENKLSSDIQQLQLRFQDLPVPICTKEHTENQLTSICLHNPRDPGTVLTLNCGQCIKELSGQSQNIIFQDYPEAINQLFLTVEASPQHSIDSLGEDHDFIEKKFELLISELEFYGQYLRDATESILNAKESYLKERGLKDFQGERIEQFIRIMEQLTVTKIEKEQFEHYLQQLGQVFPIDHGQFVLDKVDIQRESLLSKKKAIHLIKEFNQELAGIATSIAHFNEKLIQKSDFVPFQRNKKVEDEIEKLLPQIISLLDPEPPEYLDNSLIIQSDGADLIKQWLSINEQERLKLIFRSSQHGFINFQRYCVGLPDTLIVLKSDIEERVLGGFTPMPWSMRAVFEKEKRTNGRRTFLFSLDKKSQHFIKNSEEENYAIFGYPISVDDLFSFGRGFDLQVSQEGQKASSGQFGKSYQLPKNIVFSSKEAQGYLGGAGQFKVLEMEVYQIESD